MKTFAREVLTYADLNAALGELAASVATLQARLDSLGYNTGNATKAELAAHGSDPNAHAAAIRVASTSAATAVKLWTYEVDLGATPPLTVALAPPLGASPIAVLVQRTSAGDVYLSSADDAELVLDGDADATAIITVIGHA